MPGVRAVLKPATIEMEMETEIRVSVSLWPSMWWPWRSCLTYNPSTGVASCTVHSHCWSWFRTQHFTALAFVTCALSRALLPKWACWSCQLHAATWLQHVAERYQDWKRSNYIHASCDGSRLLATSWVMTSSDIQQKYVCVLYLPHQSCFSANSVLTILYIRVLLLQFGLSL